MQISPEFEDNIKKWVNIDNKIKNAKDAIKYLNEEKNTTGESILEYMKSNNLNDQQINITGGKIKLGVSKTSTPVNRKYIENRLTSYFKNSNKAKDATNYIFSNREISEKEVIKRTKSKNQN